MNEQELMNQVEFLSKNPSQVRLQWFTQVGIFKSLYKDTNPIGDVLMIKANAAANWGKYKLILPMEALLVIKELYNDKNMPSSHSGVTKENLNLVMNYYLKLKKALCV